MFKFKYSSARTRCLNPNSKDYPHYSKLGFKYESFLIFYKKN
nr:MAG TPA: hypothetical protein [Caudoviricetes sp.]